MEAAPHFWAVGVCQLDRSCQSFFGTTGQDFDIKNLQDQEQAKEDRAKFPPVCRRRRTAFMYGKHLHLNNSNWRKPCVKKISSSISWRLGFYTLWQFAHSQCNEANAKACNQGRGERSYQILPCREMPAADFKRSHWSWDVFPQMTIKWHKIQPKLRYFFSRWALLVIYGVINA